MTSNPSEDRTIELQRDDSPLPSFIVKRKEGVFVITTHIPTSTAFQEFIDRLFSHGARFTDLHYDTFHRLLYFANSTKWPAPEVRLASEIVVFSPARKSLYKEVRLMDGGARGEYMFEPALLEISYQEPIYGDADANGPGAITGYQNKTKTVATTLDFDEFVTEMWLKGVRFGIQERVVKAAIAANRGDRVVVAVQLAPTPGRDAQLHEECEGLHRDDSPMIKASGQADLRRFKNRFPQIAKGQRMMKKIPLVLGKLGYTVAGEELEPAVPKDIDMNVLSGPGTRIENHKDGEFIVAIADGFLSIDVASNQISITEKIENKGGISAKTTGDLLLAVEEFVEHGEVQEGRIVEGLHMKFTSAVYGTLESKGGRIELEDNLAGGVARSPGGTVTISKRASNATIEAVGGSIQINYAENSSIIGTTVTVNHAIHCIIVADTLTITNAEGCSIAAKSITIASSGARRGVENTVSVRLPDTSGSEKRIAVISKEVEDCAALIKARSDAISKVNANPEFAKYQSIAERVRKGIIKLSAEQQHNLHNMALKHAPTSKVVEKLTAERQALLQSFKTKQQTLEQLKADQQALIRELGCKIAKVVGDTYVRQRMSSMGLTEFTALSEKDMEIMLRERGPIAQRIFSDDKGSVDWHF